MRKCDDCGGTRFRVTAVVNYTGLAVWCGSCGNRVTTLWRDR